MDISGHFWTHSSRRHIKTYQITSRHFKTYQDTSRHFKTYQDNSRDIKTLQDISRHIKTHQDTSRHFKTYQNTSRHFKTRQDISRHIKTIQDISRLFIPLPRENKVLGRPAPLVNMNSPHKQARGSRTCLTSGPMGLRNCVHYSRHITTYRDIRIKVHFKTLQDISR